MGRAMVAGNVEPGVRALADAVPVLVWIAAADGTCQHFNRRWLEFTGRTLDRALQEGWAGCVHPDDVERGLATYRSAVERREPFEAQYRLRRADGAWREVLDRAVPVVDGKGGLSGFIGAGTDLSERQQADDALRRSTEERAAVMAVARMGEFDLDLATQTVTRDRNLEELYGLEPGSASSFDDWVALIHPEDRDALLAEVARVVADGGEYHLTHRLVRPDGRIRWLERRGHGYTDASGRVVGLRGMVIDVTDRAVAEQERAALLERVTRLQTVTAALAGAGSPDEVLEIMVHQGVEAMGAAAGSVAVVAVDGSGLEVARACGSGVAGDVAAAALPMLVDERVIGAMSLSFDRAQPFDRAQMEFLGAVVAQCAQALDRAWSYTAEAEARLAAEKARARLALLADSSIILAGSMEYVSTLAEVTRLATPLLGDCCVVDLFDNTDGPPAERIWRRVAVSHADRDAEAALWSVPAVAWSVADAAGETSTLDDLGLVAALVVPLVARGRVLGMLALGRRAPGAFSEADRSLANGLGTRVAQAVDNARLYWSERRAHEEAETSALWLRFLLDVSTTLTSPADLDRRLEQLADQAAAAIADVCLIDLVERDGSMRRVAAAASDPALQPSAQALRRLLSADPESPHPSAVAIRSRRTQLCTDVTEERLRSIASSQAHLDVSRGLGPVSYVAVPLPGIDRVLGAITLITTARSGRRYGPGDLALLEDMAGRVALGLESATMHEEMRRVAQTLQASLLPSVPPAIPGLEVGTRYVAAGEGTVVGGDFLDVFAVGPGTWAVVVGDVCGQGVEAATVTGLARHTVRSSVLEHDSPAAVLSHLNDVLLGVGAEAGGEVDPRFCTVCLARLRFTTTGVAVTLAVGGHPLPYVVRADGTVGQVGSPGTLLGVLRGADISDEDHQLGPGDALVLYTDGITERHSAAGFFGENGLERALAAAAGRTADAIAGSVEEAARHFVDGQVDDDMAVVVVRVPPA